MNKRPRRILWLLNHKTLLRYEVPLLQDLGFEVFTPKVIPNTEEYRSCVSDFAADARLTIPKRCLEQLNAFNFYEDRWTPEITAIINRYFGTAFVLTHRRIFSEAVDHFEGTIVFRAFGLPNANLNYARALERLCGPEILSKIYALGERFWFGEGYEQLHECEPPLLARRAVFLPFGLPSSAWRRANTWNGSVKKILFMCRWVLTNDYYAAVYQEFKRHFGDLPHVIVGSQDAHVADEHLLGYVTDEQLQQLFADCAVLYYHSHEPRHVHYYPVEAAVAGMPVVFYNDSLLGRLCGPVAGAVDSSAQARRAVERVLSGDQAFIAAIRRDQRRITYPFSDEYCRAAWKRSIATTTVLPQLDKEPWAKVLMREGARLALRPLAKGHARLPKRDRAELPAAREFSDPLRASEKPDALAWGIDFREERFPNFVCLVRGISHREPWGRWSIGPKITLLMNQPLQGRFRFVVVGGAYGKNIGASVGVRIGDARRTLRFLSSQAQPEEVSVEFALSAPSDVIELFIPYPTVPDQNDSRAVGLGMVSLRIEPLPA